MGEKPFLRVCLKATVEMLTDEGLVIAVLKHVLQDKTTTIRYDSEKRFILDCDVRYRIIVDTENRTIHFKLNDNGISMTIHPSKTQQYVFKDVTDAYVRMHLKCLYNEYYN